ncbi:MAG: lamin tail domain-containing protein, partial [Flavobacteriales bacterium]
MLSEPTNAITLIFNEPIQQPGLNVMQWTVNGNVIDATSAYVLGEENNELVLTYGTMNVNTLYAFNLIGIADCWSNVNMNINGTFALPQTPIEADLVINEILYDPYDGGSDFIEIYNRSNHAVSLDSCAIADATNGAMNTPDIISERNVLLMPGAYLVLTRDGRNLPQFYPNTDASRIWTVEGMSDFSSDDAVYLLLPNGEVADEVAYNSDFHFPLLNTTNGVSLERIDYNRPSDEATNWHSAAESAGFATPGIINSQAMLSAAGTTTISVEPEIFSPDNDGYRDIVSFTVLLEEPSYVGNLNIY